MFQERVTQAIAVLTASNMESLEVLSLAGESGSPETIVSVVETFSNLNVMDFEMFRIYMQDRTEGPRMQSEEDLEFEDAIAQDWDPLQTYRMLKPMEYWWFH